MFKKLLIYQKCAYAIKIYLEKYIKIIKQTKFEFIFKTGTDNEDSRQN